MITSEVLNFFQRIFIKAEDLALLILVCMLFLVITILNIKAFVFKKPTNVRVYNVIAFLITLNATGITAIKGRTGKEVFFVGVIFITLAFILSFPFFIVLKRRTLKKEEKELIAFIDKEIKKQTDNKTIINKPLENVACLNDYSLSQEKPKRSGVIDFSHVKNVLERIEFYPLTTAEKKQVKLLEAEILKAENGIDSQELKDSINDKLGALLKIMAKYGV